MQLNKMLLLILLLFLEILNLKDRYILRNNKIIYSTISELKPSSFQQDIHSRLNYLLSCFLTLIFFLQYADCLKCVSLAKREIKNQGHTKEESHTHFFSKYISILKRNQSQGELIACAHKMILFSKSCICRSNKHQSLKIIQAQMIIFTILSINGQKRSLVNEIKYYSQTQYLGFLTPR